MGPLTLKLRSIDNTFLELKVGDNGTGLPDDFDIDSVKTLGMQLIRGLTEQIQEKISIDRSCGTNFTIVFPQAG